MYKTFSMLEIPFLAYLSIIIWTRLEKNLSSEFAKNKGADQSAWMRMLVCAFVIGFFLKVSYLNLPQVKFQLSS